MGLKGERFVRFLKWKLRQRKGKIDGYDIADFAVELAPIEYKTLASWVSPGTTSIGRTDLDNILPVFRLFKQEFLDFMESDDDPDLPGEGGSDAQ